MVSDFARQRGSFATADVRGIARNQIKNKWRRCLATWLEQVGPNKMDTVGYSVAQDVAVSDFQSCLRNVRRDKICFRQLFCECYRYAAGSCADVSNLQAFADCFLWTPGAQFSQGQAIEGDFDH